MEKVYLSRRNLLALLSKLDRNKEAEMKVSECTLVKSDTIHPKYPQTMEEISVIAVDDEDYYSERNPGKINSADIRI